MLETPAVDVLLAVVEKHPDDTLGDPGPDPRRKPGAAAEIDDERRPLGAGVAAEDIEQDPRRARAGAVVRLREACARAAARRSAACFTWR